MLGRLVVVEAELVLEAVSHLLLVACCQPLLMECERELTSSTDLTTHVVRHCIKDGSFCFRSMTGDVVQAEKLEF